VLEDFLDYRILFYTAYLYRVVEVLSSSNRTAINAADPAHGRTWKGQNDPAAGVSPYGKSGKKILDRV